MSALDRLRTIAEQATTDGWWSPVTDICDCGGDWPCSDGEYAYALKLRGSEELVYDDADWRGSREDAEFIATFNPVVVSALLDVAEAASRSLYGPARDGRSPIDDLIDALVRFREVTS